MANMIASADWFANTIVAPHADKLKSERARLSRWIDQSTEFVKDYEGVPNREESVTTIKAEMVVKKKQMAEIDKRIAGLWKKPSDEILGKLTRLRMTLEGLAGEAAKCRMDAAQNREAEKFQVAKRCSDAAAEFQAKADKVKKDFETLNAKWRVPVDVTHAAELGLIEMYEAPRGGYDYRVIG